MPVILSPETYDRWLAPEDRHPEQLNDLLVPYPAAEMVAYPVSRMVNKPEYESPELIQPVG
jgi:putative SOS response-associated peptidase YedK